MTPPKSIERRVHKVNTPPNSREHAPTVIVKPPLPFLPVTFQSPWTQNSPKLFSKSIAVGFVTVTSCPSRLAQKSKPYLSGCSVLFATSTKLMLFGADSQPSRPASSEESACVGGRRVPRLPRTRGGTVLLEDRTVMFAGDWISVMKRLFGEPDERNSATVPESETSSPTVTCARTVFEVVKICRPCETRTFFEGAPWIQKPESVDCTDTRSHRTRARVNAKPSHERVYNETERECTTYLGRDDAGEVVDRLAPKRRQEGRALDVSNGHRAHQLLQCGQKHSLEKRPVNHVARRFFPSTAEREREQG